MNIEYSIYHLWKKKERTKFIDTHICLSGLVCGWSPRKLVTLAVSGEGKQVAGDGWEEEFSLYSCLCLFNFRAV